MTVKTRRPFSAFGATGLLWNPERLLLDNKLC
jgi:hypothetical protein